MVGHDAKNAPEIIAPSSAILKSLTLEHKVAESVTSKMGEVMRIVELINTAINSELNVILFFPLYHAHETAVKKSRKV